MLLLSNGAEAVSHSSSPRPKCNAIRLTHLSAEGHKAMAGAGARARLRALG